MGSVSTSAQGPNVHAAECVRLGQQWCVLSSKEPSSVDNPLALRSIVAVLLHVAMVTAAAQSLRPSTCGISQWGGLSLYQDSTGILAILICARDHGPPSDVRYTPQTLATLKCLQDQQSPQLLPRDHRGRNMADPRLRTCMMDFSARTRPNGLGPQTL
jgi:hypothetical protein